MLVIRYSNEHIIHQILYISQDYIWYDLGCLYLNLAFLTETILCYSDLCCRRSLKALFPTGNIIRLFFNKFVVSNIHSLQRHRWKSLFIIYDIVFTEPCKYCANGYLSLWHSMFVLDKTFFGIRSNKWLCHKTLSTRFVISYHILPTKATKTFLFDAQLF